MKYQKFFKKRAAAVTAISMILSAAPVFADAGIITTDTEIFSEDFESYTSMDEMQPKWFVDGNCSGCGLEEVAGKKAMYFSYSNGASPVLAMAKNTLPIDISTGTVRISFDVYLENTDNEIWSFVDYIQSVNQADYGAYQFITIHKPVGGNAYIEGIEVETGKWYNVVMDLNLGEGNKWSYGVGVYNGDGSQVGSTGKSNNELMGTFNNINFTAWKSGKVYIDDLNIQTIDRSLQFYDNMNSYSGNSQSSMVNWTCEGYDAGTTGFETIDAAHGMTAYVKSSSAPRFAPYRITSPITEGKVKLEFDTYITNDKEIWNRVTIVPSTVNDFGMNGILNISCQPGQKANISTSSLTEVAGNLDVNSWYTVKIIFDFDNKIYTVSVYDEDGNKVGDTITEYNSADALSDFSTVNFTTWRDGKFYFDNVGIKITDEVGERPNPALPLTDNFESYSTIDDMSSVWGMDDSTKSLSAIEYQQDRGNVFRLGLDSQTDNSLAYRTLPFTITNEKVNISFSMKPALSASVPVMLFNAERSNFLPVMFVSGGNIFCNTTNASGNSLFSYNPGEWYDFNIFIDGANRQYRVTKTDMSGNTETSAFYSFDGFQFNNESINNVGSINFQIWQNKNDAAYFDDFKVYYDEKKPVLTTNSISFVNSSGNSTVSPYGTISTETKQIQLNFGVEMDSWFFNNDYVKVTNTVTGEELAWNAKISGNIGIIELVNPLKGETSYTITVSGVVDSLARIEMGNDFVYSFTTMGGYAGGNVLIEGDVIKASMTNTTAAARNYIIVYAQYSGKRMVHMEIKNIVVQANIMDEQYTMDISQYLGNEHDKAKAFIWEADTFIPVAETTS